MTSVRGEVAEPGAGERERLAHRPADDEVRGPAEQLERTRGAGAPELAVGLVDDDHTTCRGGRGADDGDRRQRQGRAGRVVRRRQQYDGGPVLLDDGDGVVDVEGEVGLTVTEHPAGHRVTGVLGVHRVGRRERHRRATGPAEGLQELQHHLVGPVRRPDLVGGDSVSEVAPPGPRAAR